MSRLRDYTEYGTIGITWVGGTVFYVLVMLRVGRWLDARFATEPLFLALSLLVAIGLSFWWLVDRLIRMERTRRNPPDASPAQADTTRTEAKLDRDRETGNKFPPESE